MMMVVKKISRVESIFCIIRACLWMKLASCTLGAGERAILETIHRAEGQGKLSTNVLLDARMSDTSTHFRFPHAKLQLWRRFAFNNEIEFR